MVCSGHADKPRVSLNLSLPEHLGQTSAPQSVSICTQKVVHKAHRI